MPEVAEVAHVCALLKRNILGFKISHTIINNDPLLFPALKGSSNPEKEIHYLKKNLIGATINSVGRHGKYFWLRLNLLDSKETGVLLMHFGMTGMIKIKDIKSHLTFMENGGDKKVLRRIQGEEPSTTSKFFKKEKTIVDPTGSGDIKVEKNEEEVKEGEENEKEDEIWPPKFVKMEMTLENEGQKFELVFVDPRRLGRIRFLSGENIQTNEELLCEKPLSELGPDYSKPVKVKQDPKFTFGDPDPDNHGRPILSIEEFNKLILSKKKPIKSLLLEQQYFSGIGNWVGDEICYHSRLHPNEIISNKLSSDAESIHKVVKDLYNSIIFVCQESVRLEGDVTKFPDDWLMLYRWGKARKNSPKAKTKEGYQVDHITIGGRTSCFVPNLQKPLKKESNPVKQEDELKTKKRRTK